MKKDIQKYASIIHRYKPELSLQNDHNILERQYHNRQDHSLQLPWWHEYIKEEQWILWNKKINKYKPLAEEIKRILKSEKVHI